jgi:hypothetical protein
MRLGLASLASFTSLQEWNTVNIQTLLTVKDWLITVAQNWTHMAQTVLGLRCHPILLVLHRLVRKSTMQGLSPDPGNKLRW